MSRVAIIAALPGELKPLVQGWTRTRADGSRQEGLALWQQQFQQGVCVAACGGMGADAATRAFAWVESLGKIDAVVSYGWVGALWEDAEPGSLAESCGVIDGRTGERYCVSSGKESTSCDRWLVTVPQVVTGSAAKSLLAEKYKAAYVDMEAATVARLAAMRDLPFYLCRGVSDGVNDVLPDFNRFRGPLGEFQMTKFVAYAAIHPRYWPALVRMGENSKKAAGRMAGNVLDLLDERGYIRRRNGYPGTDPS